MTANNGPAGVTQRRLLAGAGGAGLAAASAGILPGLRPGGRGRACGASPLIASGRPAEQHAVRPDLPQAAAVRGVTDIVQAACLRLARKAADYPA